MGKIAISLPVRQIEQAKRAVAEGRARSVSAYISAAIDDMEPVTNLDEFVADWIAEFGEPDEESRAAVADFMTRAERANRGRR